MWGIKTVLGKEFVRIFKDKKMVFSVFILPVAIMLGIMALMNYMSSSMYQSIAEHQSIVYVVNMPARFEEFLADDEKVLDLREMKDRTTVELAIKDGTADLLVDFPETFEEAITNYQVGDEVPQVKTFYNPSEDYSMVAQEEMSEKLEAYRQILLQEKIGNVESIMIFSVNVDNPEMMIQDEENAGGKALSTMLPYFITLMLFAGAMGIGIDMVAGEKERGTMASLLMTPIKRSSIALGKVFALMSLSGLSAIISVVAMVIFMPMFGMGIGEGSIQVKLGTNQMIMLGLLIVALSFLYSTIIACISVFAKDAKEAGSYVMPAYMLVMMLGMMTMFQTGDTSTTTYMIPIYNAAIALGDILSGKVTSLQYLIALGMTVGSSLLLIIVMVKAFNSEKVMSA